MNKELILTVLGLAFFALFMVSIGSLLTPAVLFLSIWFFLFPIRKYPWTQRLLAATSVLFGLWLISRIWSVFAPFLGGVALAYLLDPLVDRLENWRIPRLLAAIILVIALLGAIVTLSILFLPTVAHQIKLVVTNLPALANQLSGFLESIEDRLKPLGVSSGTLDISAIRERILGTDTLLENVAKGALDITKAVTSALGTILNLILVAIVSFYLLVEMDGIIRWFGTLVPRSSRERIGGVFKEVDSIIGQWFRGQLTIALIIGILTTAALTILGTPYAALIGLIAGIFNLVPTIGIIMTYGIVLVLTPTVQTPLPYLMKSVMVIASVQLLETLILSPYIMGSRIGLHPAVIIFSIMVSAALLGPLGVIIAVPAASLVKLAGIRIIAYYKRTYTYDHEDDDHENEED